MCVITSDITKHIKRSVQEHLKFSDSGKVDNTAGGKIQWSKPMTKILNLDLNLTWEFLMFKVRDDMR